MSKKENKLSIRDEMTEFLLYTAPDGQVKVEVFLHDETIWLPQKRIAELFGVGVPAISKHLDNIYESGELEKEAAIAILETVQQEGSRNVKRILKWAKKCARPLRNWEVPCLKTSPLLKMI